MTKTHLIVLVLGLSLMACGTTDETPPAPKPAPAAPVAKAPEKPAAPAPAPAPAAAPKPAPAPTPAPAPKPDPMAAANALFDAQKYAEAAKAYEAITKEQPKNAEAWFRLGYSLHVLGQLDAAIAAHTKAAEFPDYRPVALYNLGCAQALKGNPDAAFDALNKSVDSGFNELKQLQQDEDLKTLRQDARYAALVERLTPKPKPKA